MPDRIRVQRWTRKALTTSPTTSIRKATAIAWSARRARGDRETDRLRSTFLSIEDTPTFLRSRLTMPDLASLAIHRTTCGCWRSERLSTASTSLDRGGSTSGTVFVRRPRGQRLPGRTSDRFRLRRCVVVGSHPGPSETESRKDLAPRVAVIRSNRLAGGLQVRLAVVGAHVVPGHRVRSHARRGHQGPVGTRADAAPANPRAVRRCAATTATPRWPGGARVRDEILDFVAANPPRRRRLEHRDGRRDPGGQLAHRVGPFRGAV